MNRDSIGLDLAELGNAYPRSVPRRMSASEERRSVRTSCPNGQFAGQSVMGKHARSTGIRALIVAAIIAMPGMAPVSFSFAAGAGGGGHDGGGAAGGGGGAKGGGGLGGGPSRDGGLGSPGTLGGGPGRAGRPGRPGPPVFIPGGSRGGQRFRGRASRQRCDPSIRERYGRGCTALPYGY